MSQCITHHATCDCRRESCSSCDAAIVWGVTHNGKRMPVNAEPNWQRGNVELHLQDDGELYADVLPPGKAAGARACDRQLHTSHFDDCPDAARHRRRR